jgi:hypothetical protein
MSAKEKMAEPQFRRIINALCERWPIPDRSEYVCERYWPAFSQLDDAGRRAFWDVLGVQAERLERKAMAQITAILLYPEDNYLHYNDTDIKRGVFHGEHVNQEHTIALLRQYGADEISVIVKDNNPDIPALRRVQALCEAGYTYMPTPIEGPMTWRLRRIKTDEESSDEHLLLPG